MWNPNQRNRNAPPPQAQQPYPYNPGSAAPQQQAQMPAPAMMPHPAPMQNNNGYTQVPAAATNHPAQYAQQPPAAATSPSPKGNQSAQPAHSEDDFIDNKICKFNAKNKVLDFSDMLVKAYDKDFANIHGAGGKNHAPNSGICLTLCDFSKGTGNSSVTVKFIIDVRQIDRLLSKAEAADNGTLGLAEQLRAVREFATANGMTIGWLQGNHQPTLQEVAGLQQMLCAGLMAQDPEGKNEKALYSYEVQKNNPYRTTWDNGKEYTPVSTLSIQYIPTRKYPWIIKVSNFMAPLFRQESGATTHNSKEAIGKKEVMFPMSAEDFYCALADVAHYVHLWEYRMYPVVNAMCNERERRAAAKRQNRQKN